MRQSHQTVLLGKLNVIGGPPTSIRTVFILLMRKLQMYARNTTLKRLTQSDSPVL